MHIWCGRRSVPRPRSQHARNQSLSRKSRSGDEATITPNVERSAKPKQKAVDAGSGKGVPKHEKVYSGTANGNRTKTQRRANNVSLRSPGSSKRNPIDGKGLAATTNLFRQSCLTSPRNKLQFNGKTGFSTSTCYKKAGEILPGIPGGSGAGLILTSPEGEEFTYALRFEFDASNNEAKYEALIARLRIAEQMGVKNLVAKVDSRLVANQINGSYEAKEQSMIQYLGKAKALTSNFKMFSIEQGIDISGPFPEAQGNVRFLILAIDYFTKWVEAKPVATITGNQVKKFVWENIVCRFRLPGEIISDNGKQFRDNPFKDWCEKLNIKQRFASVEEVPNVLWAHHTMIKTSNKDTPFSLTYGTEAVIPVEIGMPSLRCVEVNQAENDEGLLLNLDILEERREKAAIRKAKSKAKMEKYYNARVRSTTSAQETSSTATTKQATPKTAES
ncbi:reverse transcriptase domain-containing protein [Tanacetum coccineum]